MPIDDLSSVTRALVRLVREAVTIAPAWVPRPAPLVSPRPPDVLESEAIGLYLYHAREEAHSRAALPTSSGSPPVRYTPMGLSLSYLLTAKSDLDGASGPYLEQLMVGCAMRALQDHATVDDATVVNGVPIFASTAIDGRDNRFRLTLVPMAAENALSYWTASSSPPRLSAYYQVSVVFLEPDHTRLRTSRVHAYGVQTFVSGAPRVEASTNTLTFAAPPDGQPREVVLRPAQVPLGGRFSLLGADLAGDVTTLVLRSRGWTAAQEVAGDWGVLARSDRVDAVVATLAGPEAVRPGLYGLQVRVTRRRRMPDGTTRDLSSTSNEVPLTVTPGLEQVGPPDADGVFIVTGAGFDWSGIEPGAVEVHVDGAPLSRGNAAALAPLEFGVIDASRIAARLAADAPPGAHAVRVLVNRAEAPPAYVEVP